MFKPGSLETLLQMYRIYINNSYSQPFLALSAGLIGVKNRWTIMKSKLSLNYSQSVLQLKQLISTINSSRDETVVIDLPISSEELGKKQFILSKDFIEWFRGFTDAEGHFRFINDRVNRFNFEFVIELHKDDIKVLKYIHHTLGIGNVTTSGTRAKVYFRVRSKSELSMIIAIFSKYNLNSTKHLNFLAFAQAFMLYNKNISRVARKELKPILCEIIRNMNSKRTEYYMPPSHKISISSYWLLGFVEGDGSFSSDRSGNLTFSIGQKGNKALLLAIQDYLHNLAPIGENEGVKIYPDGQLMWRLNVFRRDFIEHVIIPLFKSVNFLSKKYLDYCDWVALFNIRNKGFHYLPEGKDLISRILSQMNNNRLSTSREKPVADRDLLLADIDKLLSRSSNFENMEDGRIFILSEGRYLKRGKGKEGGKAKKVVLLSPEQTVIKTFKSLSDCAKFLGFPLSTVSYKLRKNQPIKFQNKLCLLNRVDDSSLND